MTHEKVERTMARVREFVENPPLLRDSENMGPPPLPHVERLKATVYYGRKTPGDVVLVGGHVYFHGKGGDARKFEEKILKRRKGYVRDN